MENEVITSTSKIKIIAELAQGFEGKPLQAELLVKAAAAAGADAAKFQLVYADELATPAYKYFELFQSLEMSDDVWSAVAATAKTADIALHFDVFGTRSLALAEKLTVEAVKLHGTDIANIGFLEQVAASSVPTVMLGAGGAIGSEIERAVKILDRKTVVILLGFQAYPTPNDTNQIARVGTLCSRWSTADNVFIGFADHAPPEDATRLTLAATALGAGAVVFEKHLTLSRNLKLEDHEAALNPDEFEEFSRTLRLSAAALGKSEDSREDFGMTDDERKYRAMIRRHVVAARDLPAGTKIQPADVILKRSDSDNPMTDLELAYGQTLQSDVAVNNPILANNFARGAS